MPMQGHRVVIQKPGQVTLESCDVQEPGVGQILLKAQTTLISPGTERAFYLALSNTNATYPLYPGYSFIGEVIALGGGVTTLQRGQRVACTAHHCSHAIVNAESCIPLVDGIHDENAVFFNLIAIAMQGVRKARIELGESVLVIGAGLIGLFAIQLARLSGGLPVIAIDLNPERLELAQHIGADYTFLSDVAVQGALASVTNGRNAAVTIEATGVSSVVINAFEWTGVRGRVVLLGSTRGETNSVNFYRHIHRKGLTVIGSHEITRPLFENSPGWWTQNSEHQITLDFLAQGRIQTQDLISHRLSWREFPKGYDLLASEQMETLGMIIQW